MCYTSRDSEYSVIGSNVIIVLFLDMVYDWVNQDIYTVSANSGKIIAYSLRNFPQVQYTTKYSGLVKPREIVLEPHTS